ncbi:Ribosome-recycling factor [Borrelia miyamotoi]|uniref:Ribosome-recycling factor n=1 Tax=Borrelia miyamotoi TaxID=47466 RepID=A0AAP8YS62_9SPIR|nr:ribosome recycling factor [Borrelia miyamotoi]AHH05297.1 Ribosome Recycling Factor (RRF) [Borrelia miyamotoi FR64b]ATQ15058.1 ribosome recycling factor [Borrelia miyamotoi]ATQ16241.1 ribosome recycling factor [Borrelia miyamotoi]ATQ17384.1 ribosome recycling factor [Borrelia miyamotoi]ATQ18114.1 ribosome recycling factor [Borrelia miyamotoi]
MEEYKALLDEKMNKVILSLESEYKSLRTGRISSTLFNKISVDYYGEKIPLTRVANISIPEARLVVIQPWDKSLLSKIEQAILNSDLFMNPSNDGSVLRIKVPVLTIERRKEIVKQAKKIADEYKVAARNIRQELNSRAKKQERDSQITEDDLRRILDDIQKSTNFYIKKIEEIFDLKTKEIMEI